MKYFRASTDEGLSIYNVRNCVVKFVLVNRPSGFVRLLNGLLSETLI